MNTNSPSSADNKNSNRDLTKELMRRTSSDDNKLVIVDIIKKLQKYEKCIFRGENKEEPKYEKVSSTLYRKYGTNKVTNSTDFKDSEIIELIETDLIKKAQIHIEGADKDKALTELQHYGGNTTLIDFTYNILIALFFACNSESQENGRIIIVKLKDIEGDKQLSLVTSKGKSPRIVFQSSVFIKAKEGYLDENKYKCESIKSYEKKGILKALDEDFNITTTTVYNDIHGLIKNYNASSVVQTLCDTGLKYLNENKFDEAILYFTKAIGINPEYAEAYCSRGIAKAKLKQYAEAIKDFDKAIKINSKYAEAYYNRGNTKWFLTQHQEAIQDFDKAIEINSQDAKSYRYRGFVKSDLKQYVEAIQDFDKAIKIDPKNAEAYYNRGLANSFLKKHKEAIVDYTKAIQFDPEDANAYNNRCLGKSALGNKVGAIKDYNKAKKLYEQQGNITALARIKKLLEIL